MFRRAGFLTKSPDDQRSNDLLWTPHYLETQPF